MVANGVLKNDTIANEEMYRKIVDDPYGKCLQNIVEYNMSKMDTVSIPTWLIQKVILKVTNKSEDEACEVNYR